MATQLTTTKTTRIALVDEQDSRVPSTTKVELVNALIEHLVEKMTIGERISFFDELKSHMVCWEGTAEDDLHNHKDRNVVVES